MGYLDDLHKTMQETISEEGMSGAIAMAGNKELVYSFPSSLLTLGHLALEDLKVNIDIYAQQTSSFYFAIGIKPNEDKTPRYWQILSTPALSVGNFRFSFGFATFQSEHFPPPYIWQAQVRGNIAIGKQLNLAVSLMVPSSGDWIIKVITESGHLPTIKELEEFVFSNHNSDKSSLTSILPDTLLNGGLTIILDELQFRFDPFAPKFSGMEFKLSQTGTWTILNGFRISGWSVQMNLDGNNDYAVTGLLQGCLALGDFAEMEVKLPFPAGEQGWSISLKENAEINFPGIGALLSLISEGAIENILPLGFDKFGSFKMDDLTVNIYPQPVRVNEFRFNLEGDEDWIVWPEVLSFSNVHAQLSIKEYDTIYESTGVFDCFVNIFHISIWIQAIRTNIGFPWMFKLATKQDIHIPGLADLAKWMLPEKMTGYIPQTFMPFGSGFDITELDFTFDLTNNELDRISFTIVNSDAWQIIPGHLTLDNVAVKADINNIKRDDITENDVKVSIGVELIIEETAIVFNAKYSSGLPHWKFDAGLKEKAVISFNSLLHTLHVDKLFHIPDDLGLPVLTIHSLYGNMIPEEKYLYFSGVVSIIPEEGDKINSDIPDWSTSFLGLRFNMFGLGTEVEIKQKTEQDQEEKYYYKAVIKSVLDLNTLRLTVGMQLGSKEVDRIFTGTLSVGQIQRLSIEQWADGIVCNSDTADNNWGKLTPNDMLPITYAEAFVHYNHTKELFALYGRIKNFGDAVFLAQSAGTDKDTERGYIFAFALAKNFKFSHLFPALAPVDSVLNIADAGIVVNSYEVESSDMLVKQIDNIVSTSDKPGSITHPISCSGLPSGVVKPGVHLYSRLILSGPLFSIFKQLSDNTEGLDITLTAYFSTSTETGKGSAETVFSAIFAPFTMLGGIVCFKGAGQNTGVMMTYKKTEHDEFTLSGTIGFNVFGGSYEFIGDLLIDNDKTNFSVTTHPDKNITIPLFSDQLPALFVLKELGLNVNYYFETDCRPEKYMELTVGGKVEILENIFLEASLHLLNASPVLAVVKLTRDFSISQLICSLVGGEYSWPSHLFDITFKADSEYRHSRIYYYDAENDSSPVKYPEFINGYNLESTIDLTFLITLSVNLKVNIQKDNGLSAEVSLNDPIRIFILELASQQKGESNKKYTGSPVLRLNTKDGDTEFGLSTGINFFDYPFGTTDITLSNNKLSSGQSELKIGATLVSDIPVPVFNKFSVDFTYCESEGFKVRGLPDFTQLYKDIEDVVDIAKEVKKLMKSTDSKFICGAVTGFIADVAYTNKFSIKPSISTSGGVLSLDLNGNFSVMIVGKEIASIQFPKMLSISLPDSTSFDDFGGLICEMIKDTALSFVTGLMRNGKEWAKLASILFIENAVELAAQWLCQGLVDSATAAAITAGAEALEVLGGAAAIAAGGTTAACAIEEAIKKAKEAYEKGGGGDEPKPDPEPDPNPAKPSFPQAPFSYSEQILTIHWHGAIYATGYEIELYSADGSKIGSTRILGMNTFSTNIPLAIDSPPGYYKVRLRSSRETKRSDWEERTIRKLEAPSDVNLLLQDKKLTGSWGQVEDNKGYCVTLYESGSKIRIYDIPEDNASVEMDLSAISPRAGSFTITVAAKGDKYIIESRTSAPSLPVVIGQSEIPVIVIQPDKMTISGIGKSPELELVNTDENIPVILPGIMEYKESGITVNLEYLFPGTNYRIKVKTSNTDWNEALQIVTLPSGAEYEDMATTAITMVYSPTKSGTYNFILELLDKEHNILDSYGAEEVAVSSSWKKDIRQLPINDNTSFIRIKYNSSGEVPPLGLCILQQTGIAKWIDIMPSDNFPNLDFSFKLPGFP